MAKKKVKKVSNEDKKIEVLKNLNKFDELQIIVNKDLSDQIDAISNRIDSIVTALSQSKSVKGM